MRSLFILLLIGVLLSACHRNRPAHLIPQDKYINLLVELQLLKTYERAQDPDSTTLDSLRKVIFKKYDTSKRQFQESNAYYSRYIKKQNKRIQEAIQRLREDRMTKKDSLQKQQHDSVSAKHKKRKH